MAATPVSGSGPVTGRQIQQTRTGPAVNEAATISHRAGSPEHTE
jgi:hypothetical protein